MRRLARQVVLPIAIFCAGPALAATPPTAAEAPPPLREIVLVPTPQQLVRTGLPAPPSPGIDASRVPEIPPDVANRILGPELGKPITIKLMSELRQALQAYFQSIHRPFALLGPQFGVQATF